MNDNTSTALFLGIDGGGTKCKVRLENAQGKLLAEAISGPANIATSIEVAQKSIIAATHTVLSKANLPTTAISSIVACAGLAGANIKSAMLVMRDWQHPFAELSLTTDIDIACQGAHFNEPGAVIILGTGFCAGAKKSNKCIDFGGYGLLLSDGASGGWLGLNLFRYALEVTDGLLPTSPLINALLAQINCTSSSDITQIALKAKPAYFASFAPLVFSMPDDPYAKSLLQYAAKFITRYVDHLVSMGYSRVSLIGGTAVKITPWLTAQTQQYLSKAKSTPEQGAIQLAKHNHKIL